jgi:hypothetical protein
LTHGKGYKENNKISAKQFISTGLVKGSTFISSFNISILTSSSKVLEKALHMKLYKHSSKNNILAEEHFAFRTKSATNNAIYKLTNEILIALNNKFIARGIFCDLEKAFNCVNHKILLSKLEFYVIKGKAKLRFESYFRNGYQRVLITMCLTEVTFLHGKK